MRKIVRCDVCLKPIEETCILTINRTPLQTWMETSEPCFPVLIKIMDEAYQEACGTVRNESKWQKNDKIWYRRGEKNK